MNKTLKFREIAREQILKGHKKSTRRLFDEKDLAADDLIDLLDSSNGDKFATAKVTGIKEIPFAEMVLDRNDIAGQYEKFSQFYNREIKPTDTVKIVEFEVVKE